MCQGCKDSIWCQESLYNMITPPFGRRRYWTIPQFSHLLLLFKNNFLFIIFKMITFYWKLDTPKVSIWNKCYLFQEWNKSRRLEWIMWILSDCLKKAYWRYIRTDIKRQEQKSKKFCLLLWFDLTSFLETRSESWFQGTLWFTIEKKKKNLFFSPVCPFNKNDKKRWYLSLFPSVLPVSSIKCTGCSQSSAFLMYIWIIHDHDYIPLNLLIFLMLTIWMGKLFR